MDTRTYEVYLEHVIDSDRISEECCCAQLKATRGDQCVSRRTEGDTSISDVIHNENAIGSVVAKGARKRRKLQMLGTYIVGCRGSDPNR